MHGHLPPPSPEGAYLVVRTINDDKGEVLSPIQASSSPYGVHDSITGFFLGVKKQFVYLT